MPTMYIIFKIITLIAVTLKNCKHKTISKIYFLLYTKSTAEWKIIDPALTLRKQLLLDVELIEVFHML